MKKIIYPSKLRESESIKISNENDVNEAYTEVIACILNILFTIKEKRILFSILLQMIS